MFTHLVERIREHTAHIEQKNKNLVLFQRCVKLVLTNLLTSNSDRPLCSCTQQIWLRLGTKNTWYSVLPILQKCWYRQGFFSFLFFLYRPVPVVAVRLTMLLHLMVSGVIQVVRAQSAWLMVFSLVEEVHRTLLFFCRTLNTNAQTGLCFAV